MVDEETLSSVLSEFARTLITDFPIQGILDHLVERIVDVLAGSPADRAGLKAGDLVLEAGRAPVASAQSLQRLLFAEAIGRPLPVTVVRRGAMVDVITVPTELTGGS